MEILALSYKMKAKSDFDKSVLYAFLRPAWAGNHIVEAELLISTIDLSEYDYSLVCNSYAEAHRKAHLSQMSEKDYDYFYEHIAVCDVCGLPFEEEDVTHSYHIHHECYWGLDIHAPGNTDTLDSLGFKEYDENRG